MTTFIGIILFMIGFLFGALFIWFVRQKEIDITKSNRDQLKSEFGNLSKEALDQNLETFLKLAENKFSESIQIKIALVFLFLVATIGFSYLQIYLLMLMPF